MASKDQKGPGRIFLSPPHLSGEELEYVRRAFASNYIAPLGPQVDAFERALCETTGLAHAAALSSGTAAMHLGLRLLGVGPGDLVLASTLTFIGSVSPIRFLGADPVFVDSDQETWNMDPGLLAQALKTLDREGRRPKAVVPTDLYGQSADYERLLTACRPYGVPVLADSAEALGATYMGGHAGSRARAMVLSFNGNKIITTSGGGALVSSDKALVDEARSLAQQARDPGPHYEHSTIGYNYRLSNVLAAVGLGQIRALDQRVDKKRRIFKYYQQALAGLPGVGFMPEAGYGRCNRWLSVILLDQQAFGAGPDQVRLALEAENIEARPVWKPMHLQPVFRGCRVFGGAVAEDLFNRGLCLPSGTALTEEDMERVAGTIRECSRTNV
ncbi:MAG: DegT/DnrJ/EryC1/StrS family aminotransferase [Desulfovibrionaceae bacterium]|nr:DegT/DnrJ/EryC1/StrS family aminotransferase [Desulfovibrionaceae bacterium]